jgi:hypothetical protein
MVTAVMMIEPDTMAGIKLCECGCGGVSPFDKNTNKRLGKIKGVTQARFCAGHASAINGRKGTLKQWGTDVGEPGAYEKAKFDLTDEQVAESLEKFFSEGKKITSLCGRIFGGPRLTKAVRVDHTAPEEPAAEE